MTIAQILGDLERRGISLEVLGGKLRVRPKEAVTPDLVETLTRHKADIVRAIRRPAREVRGSDASQGKGLCPGPAHCSGCYSIGVIDGRERFLHPPKGKAITWASERVQ